MSAPIRLHYIKRSSQEDLYWHQSGAQWAPLSWATAFESAESAKVLMGAMPYLAYTFEKSMVVAFDLHPVPPVAGAIVATS